MPYEEYLQTPEWRQRRDRALSRAGWRCTLCAAKDSLQVHHNCYDNVGEERDEDLTVVCQACHERQHLGDRFDPDLRVYLVAARSRLSNRTFASVGDVAEDLKHTYANLHMPYDSALITEILARVKPEIDERRAEVQVYLFTPRQYLHIARNATAPEAITALEAAYRHIKRFPAARAFTPTDEATGRLIQQAYALVGQPRTREQLSDIFVSVKQQDEDLAERMKDILDIDRYVRRFKAEEHGYGTTTEQSGEDGQ